MNLLFELFLEELPTSEMEHMEDEINRLLEKAASEHHINITNSKFYLTPRRMALKLEFDEKTRGEDIKIVGPPKAICFKDGKPTKALEGFLKKNRATLDELTFEKTKKGEYAVIIKKGEELDTKPLIIEAVRDIFLNIHFNKKMRWGSGEFEYVRPVHNVLFLIDDELIDFQFMGKKATSYTYGHRFMSPQKVEVNFNNYEDKLKECFVLVNQDERKRLILSELEKEAKEERASLIYDDELLNEVVNLVEYPVLVVGQFEERFLKLPKEVLITSMKDHQRYFAFMKDGKLLNKFGAISNIKTDKMEIIKNGYERVLRARFSDAEFFFEEDKKHKLEDFVEKLNEMVFHERLGTQLERTNRLVELAGFIARLLGFDDKKARRAAYLSKADLLTQMVYEFPELQGIMGREYALLSGEDREVAEAIYEQYLPKEEEIPKTPSGIALSIADKIDILVGGFYAGLKPTGAKDPYGLRRAALGIIKTVVENQIFMNISEILKKSAELYGVNVDYDEILEFFKTRFKNMFDSFEHDAIESVIYKFDDIYDSYLRLTALDRFIKDDPEKEKRFAIKRVFNIVKDFDGRDVNESLFKQNEEKELFDAIKSLEENQEKLIENKEYYELLESVANKRNTINKFFDKVMVMDKDEAIRKNRLSLLNRLKGIVLNVADFKYLEI